MSNESLISAIEYYMDNGNGSLHFYFPSGVYTSSHVIVPCGGEYVIGDNLFIKKVDGVHRIIILDKVNHFEYFETMEEKDE